jgi:Fe-S oxidoreductase
MTETVQLFEPCLIDSFFPQVGEAMVHVLKRAEDLVIKASE